MTPIPTQSVEAMAAALAALMVEARGPETAHDPGVALAAQDAAELAHENGAGLVAVLTHADADPAILVGNVVPADVPVEDLRRHLVDEDDIHEVTTSETTRGYPVVIAERLLMSGAQLQAVVVAPAWHRMAVFTLHSRTGRGWLELAAILGQLVSSVDFTPPADSASR
ncbi:hypothetical protein [Actinophytocola sp.]|uniref:hypothetical protein n=1 Tax=Actinophytocola sp. TaxID=1872138 RepID=UPI00389A9FBA